MMRRYALITFAALLAGGCATSADEFAAIDSCLETGQAWNYRANQCQPTPLGPVDTIRVDKSAHLMSVYRRGQLVREFRVALGTGGLGPKERQGDGRVPEGRYRVIAHNPNSAYHLSLRIDYPTAAQLAEARRAGIDPGGDIMIHGLPNGRGSVGSRHTQFDWTDGCIAVTNREIEWLYKAVANGTPVEIRA